MKKKKMPKRKVVRKKKRSKVSITNKEIMTAIKNLSDMVSELRM